MSLIDISLPVSSDIPTWPGTPGYRLEWFMRLEEGDNCNNARIDSDIHVGTHVDAPLHFVPGGRAVDAIPPDVFVGPAAVVYLPDADVITPGVLDWLGIPGGTERLLFRTRNSELWAKGVKEFQPDFVALTGDAARWVVGRGIRLVGVDYVSVQRYGDGPEAHQVLLQAEVIILEGLNLHGVEPGEYELICLPVRLAGAEGAPARAVLRTLTPG